MILSIYEIIDIIIMIIALGVIFSTFLSRYRKKEEYDPLTRKVGFDWNSFKFAILITAPAILFHELGHKFVAMGFGLQAEFHAAYLWLGFGLILALMNTGIIFFVPAYVSILNPGNIPVLPIHYSLIAFAGPFVNFLLWMISWYVLKKMHVKKRYLPIIYVTKQINMFLFIFNMIPIPGFDGFKFFQGLLQTIF
jgi:Zn-dependent protease